MRKITFLIALFACSIGFSQSTAVSDLGGDNNPTYAQQKTTNQNVSRESSSEPSILSNTQGANNPIFYNQPSQNQTLRVNTTTTRDVLTGSFNYTDYVSNGYVAPSQGLSSNGGTIVVNGTRSSGVIDVYTDLATFQANAAGSLTSEIFDGGPGGITACGPIINSGGDATCYGPGELEEGFDMTASNATDVIHIGSGEIGNTSILVGANTFAEFTVLTFTGDPVFEVGHDIWNNSDVDTDYRVFDTGGLLIQSFNLNNTVGTENFFGIISPVQIGSIEIDGLNASGELLGNLLFTAPGGGGGGGAPCPLVGPGNAFENGKSCTQNLGRIVAHDFTVADGDDSTITDLVASVFMGPTGSGVNAAVVDFYVYEDAAGAPGALVTSELGLIPTSQVVTGTNFGFDVWDVAIDVTDVLMAGANGSATTYWIGLSVEATDASNVFWENSTAGGIGLGEAYDDGLGGGFVIDNTLEGVYTLNVDCEPIGGGGGGPCDLAGPGNAFENGKSCTQNLGRIVAHDYVVADGEDSVMSEIVASVFMGPTGSGVNAAVVDFFVYQDAAGAPGALVTSELGLIPTSQVVTGSNFGFDVWDVAVDVTDVALPGTNGSTTTYWIGISVEATDASNVFWENSTAGLVGLGEAYDDGLGGGFVIDATLEGVYTFTANCTPIGGGPTCTPVTYVAAGLPADIDPGTDVTADCAGAPNLYPVAVNGIGTIGTDSTIDNVTITITHTFDGDLDIYLVAPSGTELILSDQNGGSGQNYIDTVFMDGAGPLSGGAPPFTGTFAPDGGTFAAAFAGEAINGDWQLKVCDNFGGDTGTVDAFSLTICSPPLPDNDICADAFPVACGDVVVSETTTNTDTGGNPAPDEWYSFTGSGAPQLVTISLCDGGTDYDSLLRIFDACGGNEIAVNDDACGLQSEVSFLSDGTSTYLIMVEGFGSNSGNFSMEVTCVDPPPNDECTGALDITCGETVVGETNTASFDATAPVCVTGITAPGVWYTFTDDTGLITNYTLSMCDGGTDYDSKITVYSGDCGALACVVDNDDTCGLQSEVAWQGDGATTYYILVHGFGANTGNFSMALTCAPVPPPNDMIVNSIDVDEIGFPYTDPAVAMPAATTEAGNPVGCNIDGANGVWYNFVPDGDGFATASITSPAGASFVNFFTADSESATEDELTLVDFNGNQCAPQTDAIIPTTAGQAYYVFVVNTDGITDIVIDGNNLGADDNAIQGFTYYPNPATDVLNLNSIDTIDNVAIYNILGQQVLNEDVAATSGALDVSNLAVGAYIMKVSVNGEIGTYKIIKR